MLFRDQAITWRARGKAPEHNHIIIDQVLDLYRTSYNYVAYSLVSAQIDVK